MADKKAALQKELAPGSEELGAEATAGAARPKEEIEAELAALEADDEEVEIIQNESSEA